MRWADPSSRSATLAALAPGYGARVTGQVAGLALTVVAGPAPSRALQDAVGYARDHNALVIAAAGNEGGERPTYPAGTPGVLAVAHTTPADELAAGASHGWHVSLVAPGTGIAAAKAGGGRGGGGGSSLAAPHVAGVAALVMSAYPAWSADQVRARLLATADDLGPPGVDVGFGHGRVNARRALAGAPAASL